MPGTTEPRTSKARGAFVSTVANGSLFSDVRGWHSVVVGSIYSRLFARSYDSFLAWGERDGMQTLRQNARAEATGWVLEIGAGTGLKGGSECHPSCLRSSSAPPRHNLWVDRLRGAKRPVHVLIMIR